MWSWALYDWANSAFATTVMAGFFPLFFKQYWSAGVDPARSTFWLGAANSAASALIVVLAPVLGAVADRGGGRKRFLAAFAGLGVAGTAALTGVGQGGWAWAAAAFVVATVGFMGANVFYDALLVDVTGGRRMDRVSALGYSLGYLGGGLLFGVNVAMTLRPGWFGFADAAQAVRASFLTVAVWWALFSVPLLAFVRERAETAPLGRAVRDGLVQLRDTVRDLRGRRQVWVFLVAYWLYIDGVDTIVRMAVDYGLALGLDSGGLIKALLITQFVGFPAALAYGWLGERIGPRTGILVGLAAYAAVTVWAYRMETSAEFYLLAGVIGLVQGGVQALSRSLYARLIPPDRAAEYFGVYNMLGKFAAVLGPVLMGWIALATGEPRTGVFAVTGLVVAGGVVLAVSGVGAREETT